MEHESVLVIFPHPDDEAFGVAGTIALYTQRGIPVTYACGTLGEMGRNMGLELFANRETMPMIRKAELEEACRVMGINDLRMLGFRDKTLEFEEKEEVADRFEELINEINPSIIMTFYPGHAVHPDHDACGAAVVTAVERMPVDKRPKIHCKAFSKNRYEAIGQPDIVQDVESVFETKVAALKAHKSQTGTLVADIEKKLKNNNLKDLQWLIKEEFWIYKH